MLKAVFVLLFVLLFFIFFYFPFRKWNGNAAKFQNLFRKYRIKYWKPIFSLTSITILVWENILIWNSGQKLTVREKMNNCEYILKIVFLSYLISKHGERFRQHKYKPHIRAILACMKNWFQLIRLFLYFGSFKCLLVRHIPCPTDEVYMIYIYSMEKYDFLALYCRTNDFVAFKKRVWNKIAERNYFL